MKFKNLLLLSGLALVTFACKRAVENPEVKPIDGEQVISLSSPAVLSRAANVGVRNVFEAGDQIGVIAVWTSNPETPATNPVAPDWSRAPYFENIPAAFVSNNAETPAITSFGWGPLAEGGKAFNQYYPSKKRAIYLFSYYPYTATSLEKPIYEPITIGGATDVERQPKLAVTLVSGVIDGSASDVLTKQPDVLYYAPTAADSVSSEKISGPFAFKHALAQIRFTVKRPVGSKPCTFQKLVFKSTAKAKLNLATGKFDVPAATANNRKDAVYTITMASSDSTARAIPISPAGADPAYLDILNPAKADLFNYLMVLPLSETDARLGELILTCNFGEDTNKAKEELVEFNIPLSLLVAFSAGDLNTLAISVSQFNISVTASITPWGTGTTTELPAE